MKSIPIITISEQELIQGVSIIDLFFRTKLFTSKSEIRRLIQQGGIYVDNTRIMSIHTCIKKVIINNN